MMWFWVAEPFLYICFAILCGNVLFRLLPEQFRPVNHLPVGMAITAALGVGLFSLFPIIRIVTFFAEDIGWGLTFRKVLLDFTEGRIYLFTLLVSLLLAYVLYLNRHSERNGSSTVLLLLVALLITAQGWSSHIAAWYGTWGIWAQTFHVLAVSLWLGPLLLASYQEKNEARWLPFLSWYQPVAFLCLVVIAASGFVLTVGIAPEYLNAWKLSYGQALLIKHLLILPLLFFVTVNSFWVKRRLKADPFFNPQPWARVESLVIVLIFSVTGFMNQQAAPHDVSETLNESPPSSLYLWFSSGSINKAKDLSLAFDWFTVLIAVGMAVTIWVAVTTVKRRKPAQTFIWSVATSLLLYLGLMSSIQ